MGRRKRRVIKVVKRTLPKVFSCPRCGMISVKVRMTEENVATISCGSCGLRSIYDMTGRKEPIDIYNIFVDRFMLGKVGG